MTFDEKMDKAERLLSLHKKFNFMKPEHGFYATGVGAVLVLMDFNYAASILLLTSIVIGLVGVIFMFVGHKAAMKGFELLGSCADDFIQAIDNEELARRMRRHSAVLAKAI